MSIPEFPDDLPWVVVYRLGMSRGHDGEPCPIVKSTLPRRPVSFIGSSGNTDAAMVCPTIPHGCTGWKLLGETEWKPISELPPHWLPFLQRERGTAHDSRHKPCQTCHDAACKASEDKYCIRCWSKILEGRKQREQAQVCEEAPAEEGG